MIGGLALDLLAGGLVGVALVVAALLGVVLVLVRLGAGYPSRGRHAPGARARAELVELPVERTARGEPVGP